MSPLLTARSDFFSIETFPSQPEQQEEQTGCSLGFLLTSPGCPKLSFAPIAYTILSFPMSAAGVLIVGEVKASLPFAFFLIYPSCKACLGFQDFISLYPSTDQGVHDRIVCVMRSFLYQVNISGASSDLHPTTNSPSVSLLFFGFHLDLVF